MKSNGCRMSSTQANKAHKQEGTLASKMHKQGALNTSVLPRVMNLEVVKIEFRHLPFLLSFFSQPSDFTRVVDRTKQ